MNIEHEQLLTEEDKILLGDQSDVYGSCAGCGDRFNADYWICEHCND